MNPRKADADLPPKYTPAQIAALRRSWNLSAKEFGELLGFKDAARVVRALESGEWHGKEYRLTGASMMALRYLQAIKTMVDAYDRGAQFEVDRCLHDLCDVIPKRMRA